MTDSRPRVERWAILHIGKSGKVYVWPAETREAAEEWAKDSLSGDIALHLVELREGELLCPRQDWNETRKERDDAITRAEQLEDQLDALKGERIAAGGEKAKVDHVSPDGIPRDEWGYGVADEVEKAIELSEQLHYRSLVYGNKEQHDAWVAARATLLALFDRAREETEQYKQLINDDGSLTTHEELVAILRDAMHALQQQPKLIAELSSLRAPMAAPPAADGEIVAEAEQVQQLANAHATRWLDRDDAYWFQRLTQEVGELGSSLAGDHDDPPEHELRQIGSIAINWLRKRAALPASQANGGTGA